MNIHFINPRPGHYATCGTHGGNMEFTLVLLRVTCKNCKKTRIFKRTVDTLKKFLEQWGPKDE